MLCHSSACCVQSIWFRFRPKFLEGVVLRQRSAHFSDQTEHSASCCVECYRPCCSFIRPLRLLNVVVILRSSTINREKSTATACRRIRLCVYYWFIHAPLEGKQTWPVESIIRPADSHVSKLCTCVCTVHAYARLLYTHLHQHWRE